MSSRIESGTKTFGSDPSVVPVKPAGATPTIVIGCPFTISLAFRTAGLCSK
jgi:hypothetical protein